jgi:hypothetical protein
MRLSKDLREFLELLNLVSSAEALATRIAAEIGEIPVFILGKDALIRNKKA